MKTKKRSLSFGLTVAFILSCVATGHAAPDFDSFKGKVITYVVATKPGGGYDAYARMIGRYMQKYIPGATIIIKNTPGAGHIIGANDVYRAKPDGLTMGTFSTGLIYSQIVGLEGIKFDLNKYSWIGKASSEHRVLIVSAKSPIKTIKDFIDSKEPVKMGSSGVGTADHNETLIIADALGAKVNVIAGFGGQEAEMSMLRGELTGLIGSYSSLSAFIKGKECRVLLQIARTKHKELPDVPLAMDQKLSDRGKKLVALVSGIAELWRLTAAPPNVPAEKLEVIRTAYRKALTDPELLKEAAKMEAGIDPSFGEDVAKLVKEALDQPQENITLLKQIVKE
jgi:tripartite-type tricarboxylate transporter receptor subunit TctC